MNDLRSHMHAVIMAGGSGTRFWPLSREKMPKQLLQIGGEDTLIRETIGRILPLIAKEKAFIVTNDGLCDTIAHQLSSRFGNSWEGNLIVEPQARNTAAALALAALHLERLDREGIMVVLSADHFIRDAKGFLELLQKAGEAAAHGYLVTLGITPDRPETGYGYILAGEKCVEPRLEGVSRVKAFVEKPDLETAKRYVASGTYFWNSGIFVWRTSDLLAEIGKHHSPLAQGIETIRKSLGTPQEAETIKKVFSGLESISIDYAVMERTDRAAIIPADIGWSDVGSWPALDDVSQHDRAGNVMTGNVLDIDSRDSIIYAERRLVATIGLKEMIVVDTPDATLVCNKDRAQDVKKVVDELKKRKAEEHLIHRTVHRPWGSYTVLEEGDRYKIKRIMVNPGAKLSQQMHHHRSEHWVVVSGTARVTNGDREYDVHPNESTYIPISTKHRLENSGKIPLQIIEVQNGEYLGEDDIVRFDDVYRRHETASRSALPPVGKEKA